MEFVPGTTLAQPILARESISEEDLRHWLREVILGLEHMHLHEVAHRDVKPGGIEYLLPTAKSSQAGPYSSFLGPSGHEHKLWTLPYPLHLCLDTGVAHRDVKPGET
jgi:serine/threonine protein kinase